MSLSIVYSRARVGIEDPLVTVEVHLSNGITICRSKMRFLPLFVIAGILLIGCQAGIERIKFYTGWSL